MIRLICRLRGHRWRHTYVGFALAPAVGWVPARICVRCCEVRSR